MPDITAAVRERTERELKQEEFQLQNRSRPSSAEKARLKEVKTELQRRGVQTGFGAPTTAKAKAKDAKDAPYLGPAGAPGSNPAKGYRYLGPAGAPGSLKDMPKGRVPIAQDRYGKTPKMKATRDAIRMQFGFQAMEQAGFLIPVPVLDANGEAVKGPNGQAILDHYEVAPLYAGEGPIGADGTGRDPYRFGPQGGGPAQRASSSMSARNLSMLTGMSVSEILSFYNSLSEKELIQVQHKMMEAGLYDGGKPILGTRDASTMSALANLMTFWASNPDVPITTLLDKMAVQQMESTRAAMNDMSGTGVASDLVKNIKLTDEQTYADIIDAVAVDVYGSPLQGERKAALVAKLREQEKAYKTKEATDEYQQAVTSSPASELDSFMNALIGQESGGKPNAVNERTGAAGLGQMLYWYDWAKEAGQDPNDFSETNQRRVIKFKLGKFYAQYGNWADVASVWYSGGPASGYSATTLNRGQGPSGDEPSIQEYINGILGKMNAATTANLGQGAQTPNLDLTYSDTLPDATKRAEQELKALDPARYAGSQYAKQADVFFRLIRGVN